LLQIDILPQKLSRRNAIVIFPAWSGVALDQNRHCRFGEPQRIRQPTLFAEVWQRE